ncbi:MAG: hypothetical protein U5O39_07825 [Gammaproteobacteria bacterium]|nr:hypothetical protein [Gammaproteobacteria bacterium]
MKSLSGALSIIAIALVLFFSSALSAAEFPAGYKLTFRKQVAVGPSVSDPPIRGDSFGEFSSNLDAAYQASIPSNPACIGRGGSLWHWPTSVTVSKHGFEGHEAALRIYHTHTRYYCSRGWVYDIKRTSNGTLQRYCPAGFERIRKQRLDGIEDTFCVGPELQLTADTSVYPPVIIASLDDAGSGDHQVTFSIVGFNSLDGSAVPPEAWGDIADNCSITLSEQGDGSCTVNYEPESPVSRP